MSKFSERLSSLGQSAPARMGFGKSAAREKNPVLLVIGKTSGSKGDADSVDLLLQPDGSKGEGDWGLEVNGAGKLDAEKLSKDGCQFLLISSEDTAAELLLSEELALGMPVADGLEDKRIRAIEDSPFEFLLYQPDSLSWPLDVGQVFKLQDLVSSFSKHIFLQVPSGAGLPGEKDLEVLKNLPVSALVIDLSDVKAADAAKLKESVAKLEPRKPSGKAERSPLVPLAGRQAAEEVETESDDFEDEEDWDE